ncbi:uncharacterized protein LOC115262113 [Aedes albopictus]
MINNLAQDKGIEGIVNGLKTKYSKIFDKDFSEPVVGYEGDLVLKSDQPIFKKAYTVPYKLKEKMEKHLEMLEQQKVITPIKASEWASPVIVVVKKDQDIRMDNHHGSQESVEATPLEKPKFEIGTTRSAEKEAQLPESRRHGIPGLV